MKTLIIGTLDFLGHIYAVAIIAGGAAYGFTAFGPLGLLGGFLGGIFVTSITVGLLFLLLDIRDSLRRIADLMEGGTAAPPKPLQPPAPGDPGETEPYGKLPWK